MILGNELSVRILNDTFVTYFQPNLANKLGFNSIDCVITEISVREYSWGSESYEHHSKCSPNFKFPCLPFAFIVICVSILFKVKKMTRWFQINLSNGPGCNVIGWVIAEIFVVEKHIFCRDVHLSILWFLADSLLTVPWVRKRPRMTSHSTLQRCVPFHFAFSCCSKIQLIVG